MPARSFASRSHRRSTSATRGRSPGAHARWPCRSIRVRAARGSARPARPGSRACRAAVPRPARRARGAGKTTPAARAPAPAHHRVHVFVGAEVAEPGGEIQVAREEPAALGLEQGHVVGCVAGGVNHPESESRRLEALAERRGGGRRPGAPGDAAVQLWMGVRRSESRYANRVRQGGNPQLGREQAMVSGVILVMMGGDTLPHREVGNQPSHVVGEVGRARVHEQPVDEIDTGPVDRPSQHGPGHPEIAHVAVVEADDHARECNRPASRA